MRTHSTYLRLAVSALTISGLFLTGCVDEQETLPAATTPGIQVHPDGWKQPSSAEFHGNAIRAANWDLSSCQTCHGTQYNGGTAQKSCLTCHTQAEGPEDCATCHGSAVNAAPPEDTEGNTASTSRGVGAHQAHLIATSGKILSCGECHVVPTAFMSIGHIDTTQFAEVVMDSALANTTTDNGSIVPNPTYSPTTLGCSSIYCHGTFKNGNTTNVATWTDPSTAVCGTCHGDKTKSTLQEKAHPKTAALGGDHPPDTQCQWCHSTIDASGVITNVSSHIDGTVNLKDLSNDCSACHGSATNDAPPVDLQGNSAVTVRGVGAHQAHLGATAAKPVACAECHTIPTAVYDVGHLDTDRPAEVVFNGSLAGLATTGVTPVPAYSPAAISCSDTYCHGSFTNGNPANSPVWNGTAGSAAQCGSCHGDATQSTTPEKALPKTAAAGGTHPSYLECQWCHTSVTAGPSFTNVNDHVDGTVPLFQWSTQADCSRCHGSVTNAAPPADLAGNTSSAKVGAHQTHLNPSVLTTNPVACTECHTVPANLDYTGADGHLDGTAGAELMFGAFSAITTGSGGVVPNPVYTSTALSCGSIYCHGTFQNGNLTNAPVWSDPSTAACGTCHGDPVTGNPRPGGSHTTSNSCNFCHTVTGGGNPVATYNSGAGTWSLTNKDFHIDGKLSLFAAERDPWP